MNFLKVVRSLHSESLVVLGGGLFVSVHRPLQIFYLSHTTVWSLNIEQYYDCLLLAESFSWFLSCQHLGNFFPAYHPDRQKFWMDSVSPYLWIFQMHHGHMLYNCGMIFFILSVFIGYILSFGLVRLWIVRLLVQVFMLARRMWQSQMS